jgi:molybdate transport system substrate-binding protein
MKASILVASVTALSIAGAAPAGAAEIKVLSAGAYKSVVVAIQPEFEKQTGHKLVIDNDTVGALTKRVEDGEAFDMIIVSPGAVDDLIKKGKAVTGTRQTLARVGIGVMVKEGAPKPDISTVDAFKKAVLDAKTVAYIDPASGGSSGIYLASLFEKLGIANAVRPKAKLKQGGYVADLIVSGEAEIGIHQISEILPVKGVTLVGPLPAEIQNYTTYAAGLSASARDVEAAKALIQALAGSMAAPVLKSKGMDSPAS